MRKRPHRTLIVAVLLASILLLVILSVSPGRRRASFNRGNVAMAGNELRRQFPWLSEVSKHWYQDVDLASRNVRGYSDLGCFALGNGRLFATEGLRYPFGTLSNIFGPTYQKNQGSLGRQDVGLLVGGRPQSLPMQRTEYVLRSGVVHTELRRADGVQLEVYDCIPFDGYAICRVLLVSNDSKRSLRNVALWVSQSGAISGEKSGRLVADGPPRWVRVGFVGARTEFRAEPPTVPLPPEALQVNKSAAESGGSTLVCPLGTLKPGESLAKLAYLVIAPSGQVADAEEQRLAQVGFGALQETRDWWQKWYADALTIETPDERINEFIPIEQYLCRIQQAESGGYSPMYMYTTCWVRDSNGPVRFLTQSGKFEEVKRYLDYYYACSAQARRIPMNFPLDVPLRQPLPTVDWSKAPTERAEVASFIILQHYWYWKQSGDLTPVREHWEYLRRNLLGQQVDERGRLPFHGDETYRFPGYQIFQATQKEPTDWVSMDLLSADSAWEYVAAAGALHEWANVLGKPEEAAEYARLAKKVRDALDRDFWMPDRGYYAPAISDFSGEQYRYPFANINLGAVWLGADLRWGLNEGYLYPAPESATENALRYLWRPSGTVSTTPGCGYYVGMTPGYVVWNLAALRHPSLAQAMQGLLNAASPAGEYSEMHRPDDRPTDKYWGKNRVRPWEGGINAEALVVALAGLQLNPSRAAVRFRPSVGSLVIRNLRVGESLLDADWAKQGEVGTLRVRVRGQRPVRVAAAASALVEVRPGGSYTFSVGPVMSSVIKTPLSRRPFSYGEPTFAGRAKTIVVTWSKDTFAAYRNHAAAAIDTRIAFPPEYLAAALYDKQSKRRADTLILDVSKYPGHCKTAEFWTTGEGKKIIDRFTSLGGKVEQYAHPKDKPGDLFGE